MSKDIKDNNDLISKNILVQFIKEFMNSNRDLIDKIKISQETHDIGSLYILRCEFFTKMVDTLEDKVKVSDLASQHDFLKALLHFILHKGNIDDFETLALRINGSIYNSKNSFMN